MSIGERGQGRSSLASGIVFLVGAGAYALVQGPGGADFNLTPLFVGTVAIVAGLSSHRRRRWPPGCSGACGPHRRLPRPGGGSELP